MKFRQTAIIINGFLHDFAAGIWLAAMVTIATLHASHLSQPFVTGVLNSLERRFFWGSVAAMVVIFATGAGRTFTYVDNWYGEDAERLRRHFLRGAGANSGFIRVKPELQRLVEFHPFNLMDARWSMGDPFEIVFCRNVMIYFDAPTQRAVLGRMHGVMGPRGLLFAGHSENFTESKDLFRLRGKTVYERV